jgi:RNA polymerase sigma-70 factor, ECF subfamily
MNAPAERNPVMEPGREAALVRAAQQGDQAAFAQIVRGHQRGVYRVAYALTPNATDADDLAQETFVRAYQALGRFRADEPLRPWLARITVNLAYSLHRRRRRRPETSIEPLLEAGRQWAAGGDDPSEQAAAAEGRRRLARAYDDLSPEHRVVLSLRVVEDLSYDEIARMLNVPVGTVMSRLSRARAELRRRLPERNGEAS